MDLFLKTNFLGKIQKTDRIHRTLTISPSRQRTGDSSRCHQSDQVNFQLKLSDNEFRGTNGRLARDSYFGTPALRQRIALNPTIGSEALFEWMVDLAFRLGNVPLLDPPPHDFQVSPYTKSLLSHDPIRRSPSTSGLAPLCIRSMSSRCSPPRCYCCIKKQEKQYSTEQHTSHSNQWIGGWKYIFFGSHPGVECGMIGRG